MASKMPAARDEDENLVTIDLAEQGQYRKPLRCEFCDAAVSFVNGHTRQVGDDVVAVEPFFRLVKGHAHNEGCGYDVVGQIAVIARESEGDVLAAIENNRFELRLLAVKKALDQLRAAAEQKRKPDKNRPAAARDKTYLDAETKLGAYINSAKRVLKVRAVCHEHAEIEDALKLVFDGVRVPWSDFYFEDGDYFSCYRQLRNATVQIPVAIQGTVKAIKPVKGETGTYAVLDLVRPLRATDRPAVREAACASIWSPDLHAFVDYQEGQQIIAFGMWQGKPAKEVANKKPNSSIKTFVNYEMRLWPVTRSQLCHT